MGCGIEPRSPHEGSRPNHNYAVLQRTGEKICSEHAVINLPGAGVMDRLCLHLRGLSLYRFSLCWDLLDKLHVDEIIGDVGEGYVLARGSMVQRDDLVHMGVWSSAMGTTAA